MDYDLIVVKTLERVYKNYYYIIRGKKYKPCASCKNRGTGAYVYVLPYGESYHAREDCTSLSAYVQEVPLSQVEYMGGCSYCSQ